MADATVVYHFDLKTIDVEIWVEKGADEKLKIFAATPVILLGDWKVTWTLQAGPGITVRFTDGIEIIGDTPPLLVIVDPSPAKVLGSSWTISFTNGCDSAQNVKYNIIGEVTVGEPGQKEIFNFLTTPEKFHHDPTIAVVGEPITG